MINIIIITIFPEIINSIINYGIINKAIKNKLLNINILNLKNFSKNKYKSIDSSPYGGGGGMLIMCEPVVRAVYHAKKIIGNNSYVIYLSPKGKIVNNSYIQKIMCIKSIILISGRYEGIDERLLNICINEELSIGDYVLSGGEIPAMIIVDLISRNIPGNLKDNSIKNESFFNGLLDYPSYTKPKIFMNIEVPKILLSGNHEKILEWRLKQSLGQTWIKRPDLLCKKKLNNKEILLLKSFKKDFLKENK